MESTKKNDEQNSKPLETPPQKKEPLQEQPPTEAKDPLKKTTSRILSSFYFTPLIKFKNIFSRPLSKPVNPFDDPLKLYKKQLNSEQDIVYLKKGEKDYPSKFSKVYREGIIDIWMNNEERKKLKRAEEKETKQCCCSALFYCHIRQLFKKGSDLKKQDLNDMAKSKSKAFDLDKIITDVEDSKQLALLKGNPKIEIKSITKVVYPQIRWNLFKVVVIKIISITLAALLSMLLGFYLRYLKTFSKNYHKKPKPEDRNFIEKLVPSRGHDIRILLSIPIIACLITLINSIMNEHSKDLLRQNASQTKKIVKKLIFNKLTKASREFLKFSDSSLLNKLILFETQAVAAYYKQVPNFFIFPYNLFVTVSAMVNVANWTSSVTFVVFLFSCISLIRIVKVISVNLQKKAFYTSKRSSAVFQLLNNLEEVKALSLEDVIEQQIQQLRVKEMEAIDKIDSNRSFSTFVFALAPVISLLLILVINKRFLRKKLDVAETFTLLSLITGLTKPLKQFFLIMDRHGEFKESKQSLNEFLFNTPNKPISSLEDKNLFQGFIIFENCDVEKYSKKSMQRLFATIYSKDIVEDVNEKGKKVVKPLLSHKQKKENIRKSQGIKKLKRVKVFKNLNLIITPSSKVAVLGENQLRIQDFIYTILGETIIQSGSLRYKGRVIYSDLSNPQYLTNQTYRNNLLMGNKFMQERYNRVVKQLGIRFKSFVAGDMTEILPDAKNLSRSQKRNLILARIMYDTADIVILKSFFGQNEIESEVELYKNTINSFLKYKTVILVTRSEHILRLMDTILLVKGPNVEQYSNLEELKAAQQEEQKSKESNEELEELKRADSCDLEMDENAQITNHMAEMNRKLQKMTISSFRVVKKELTISKPLPNDNKVESYSPMTHAELTKCKDGKKIFEFLLNGIIMVVNRRTLGKIENNWDESPVYTNLISKLFQYLNCLGKYRFMIQIFNYTLSVVLFFLLELILGYWSYKIYKNVSDILYLMLYIICSVVAAYFIIVRDASFSIFIYANADYVHDRVLKQVLNLRLQFYNNYKNAHVGSKLSIEMRNIDDTLNFNIPLILEYGVSLLVTLGLLNYVYFGPMAVATIFIFWYVYGTMIKYINTVTQLVKFQNINLNVSVETYKLSLDKMLDYRCSKIDHILTKKLDKCLINLNKTGKFLKNYANRWLGMRKMRLNCILVLFAYSMPALIKVFLKGYFYKRSLLSYALALTYSLRIGQNIDGFITALAPILTEITAYGRLENFIKNAKCDNQRCKKLNIVDREKPEYAIWFKHCNLYLSHNRVLKNVSVRIKRGFRAVFWGSHGAGKHVLVKLIMSIYNLDENQEETDGKFYSKDQCGEAFILGYDVNKVNLRELRQRISYLDNGFLKGYDVEIRKLIDPEMKLTDYQIYKLIKSLNLMPVIEQFLSKRIILSSRMNTLTHHQNSYEDQDDPKKSTIIELSKQKPSMLKSMHKKETNHSMVMETERNLVNEQQEASQIEPYMLTDAHFEFQRLKKFLGIRIKPEKDNFSDDIKKVIFLAKEILSNNELYIIEERALTFSFKGNNSYELYKKIEALLPNSTIILLKYSQFSDILDFDQIVFLHKGRVLESGSPTILIRNKKSKISKFLKLFYPRVYQKVLTQALGKNEEETNKEQFMIFFQYN